MHITMPIRVEDRKQEQRRAGHKPGYQREGRDGLPPPDVAEVVHVGVVARVVDREDCAHEGYRGDGAAGYEDWF